MNPGNVWAVIHSTHPVRGDVAVAAARRDDPGEWERAHHDALRNMHHSQREAERWATIADDLQAQWGQAQEAQWDNDAHG